MKKITALAIGLGLILGGISYAQDKMDKMTDDKKSTDKKKGGKKGKKTTDTPSKN